ncbi:DNA translocase FtsK 4TM domain-containing protein, partial [uncultured Chryseobacterium sp.]|uniref:DNA translocase FtsK 4TM domain-containing protein n=1 Tax=uncultured Chryseobacterium sp. TaxID=259322 RepID=UPI00258B5D9C
MDKKTQKKQTEMPEKGRILSKPRIFFGLTLILFSAVLALSFISYLMNWKADQSQAGTMLDKTIKSSNIFGKVGDWLGNIFIFESIGIASFIIAFLFLVVGTLILKKKIFKPWKTIGHSLFFICWLPIFMGALTKGQGVLGGVYGYQIMDYLNSIIGAVGLWTVLAASILLYFILEFNLRPSSIKSKLNRINENTIGKVKSMMPDSNDDFEADEELKEEAEEAEEESPSRVTVSEVSKATPHTPVSTIKEPEPVSVPKGFPEVPVSANIETISTPNHTSFEPEPREVSQPVSLNLNTKPVVPVSSPEEAFDIRPSVPSPAVTPAPAGTQENIKFNVEVAPVIDVLGIIENINN